MDYPWVDSVKKKGSWQFIGTARLLESGARFFISALQSSTAFPNNTSWVLF